MKISLKLILCLISLSLFLVALAAIGAYSLSSPKRRALQDYHYSWLNTPEKHGLRIEAFTSKNGTPALIAEPAGILSKRGAIIRSQIKSPPKFGEINANLVLLHGRKGRKADLLPVAERFCAVGFRCIIPDLPAHGDHPAKKNHFATGKNEELIISDLLLELYEINKWEPMDNHLCGMSMGGAFANKTLKSSPELWKRAVILCSFDKLSSIIDRKLAPASFLKTVMRSMVYSFSSFNPNDCNPSEWAKSIPHPMLVVHGNEDKLITLQQGKDLFSAYPNQNKKFVTVEGAHHTNILVTDYPLYAEMAEWLLGDSL